ncbi:hypothetical protein K504DRAFT_508959 [Pleomassaria siparia CBS 279.74]|uniref:Uncharacterized protein n=1 Tax=Pleomassaria siparia CBS 279.74 TaxID=1314801 RepID=A0A6G1JQK8_9PLEO|nr:hypothetical protein K504DRAFT_508959 [Pleomassaria siparia CBS 279.74]
MVAKCNPDVVQMAAQIELLFLACMDESAPPPENQAHDDREGQADRERNVIGDTMQATLKDQIQAEILLNGTAAPSFGQG